MGLRRRGAKKRGRRKTGVAGVPHLAREAITKLTPVHVTMKTVEGLPLLRRREEYEVVQRALRAGRERAGRLEAGRFRIVHFSALGDHLHLLVEADSAEALARGAGGLSIRIAKALNKLWQKRGKVWRDRFHAHVLKTPREAYNAVRYVFTNARKHGFYVPPGAPDPCSSARFFDGWKDFVCAAVDPVVRPVVKASTWLLRVGWSKAGELRLRPQRAPC